MDCLLVAQVIAIELNFGYRVDTFTNLLLLLFLTPTCCPIKGYYAQSIFICCASPDGVNIFGCRDDNLLTLSFLFIAFSMVGTGCLCWTNSKKKKEEDKDKSYFSQLSKFSLDHILTAKVKRGSSFSTLSILKCMKNGPRRDSHLFINPIFFWPGSDIPLGAGLAPCC